ncbi:HEAT repeat domain-containing protein [Microvenator marinus]|uniref:HEAT repeat domain-containing protein n=1 Tax=Microvenator marinus TaxID=2600177 RepID=A0A5B8XKW7_9DELT|nr:HEAT repeat domain-containing protein [Microvenator marinus]QED25741.1 HEAT repeat domain-containing protein [Microvenator marinus]
MKLRYWIALTVFGAACATAVTTTRSPDVPENVQAPVAPKREPLPPAPLPAPPPETFFEMPYIGADAPQIGLLPDEAPDISRSVGTVTEGWLANSERVIPNEKMLFLEVHQERGLHYTSTFLKQLMEKTAEYVWDRHQSPLLMGNFGAPGGGDIPYSVSHNSGRDADLAFHMLAPSGNVWVPKSFVEFDENGQWVDASTGGVYRFDVARNWTVIEGLLTHHEGQIQMIFVSNGLRRLLLNHAAAIKAPPAIISDAARVLVQPGGALPHNDHFHIRVFCSVVDIESGCEETGRWQPNLAENRARRAKLLKDLRVHLSDTDPSIRAHAVQRLVLLQEQRAVSYLGKLLDDSDSAVRVATARAWTHLEGGHQPLIAQLEREENWRVRLELISGLSGVGAAKPTLISLLESGEAHQTPYGEIREEWVVAGAVATSEDQDYVAGLIRVMSVQEAEGVAHFARALAFLTNQQFESAQEWVAWYEEAKSQTRDEWLASGFQAAGFSVQKIGFESVWELCRAISGSDPVSHNAQKALMRLSGQEVPSLLWSKWDASFYWRRFFERKIAELGLPQIPPELSTAGGYVKEDEGG